MTSPSDDTMWYCEKCNLSMYLDNRESHLREWHNDLSAEPVEAPQAPELDGPA